MTRPITYRDADPDDADGHAALFADTFRETFGHLYRTADLATFLADHVPAAWAGQLRDGAYAVRVAEDDALVGFAKLGPVKLPVEASGPALELRQLYVLRRVRGAGVAAELMDWAIHRARADSAEELYLSVYTENLRARRFYMRHGFVEVGPCLFMVGDHADNDIILKRRLV